MSFEQAEENTALIKACIGDHVATATALLDGGADVNKCNVRAATCVHQTACVPMGLLMQAAKYTRASGICHTTVFVAS